MQFGGQRTDMNLKTIGKPHNFYIKLTDDILPDPEAILVTGITPQRSRAEGMTEAEFLRIFTDEIATPDSIFVGFNTVRFDDEFMRYMHYRNFYDPYEWQWRDGRSRWDLLDVVRMTRALRPEGIEWAYDSDGKPSNRLGLLTTVNKLTHENIHDALSDVTASIAVARLVQSKQPKLFDFLLAMRKKDKVSKLVMAGEPFVYTSGKYPSESEKTTIAVLLAEHPKRQGVLVYDLRHDPTPFLKMEPKKLAEAWKWQPDPEVLRLPIKTLQFNRCPAVAPLSVLQGSDSVQRLSIDLKAITTNRKKIQNKAFIGNILKALDILDMQQQTKLLEDERSVDSRLYDGFFGGPDRQMMRAVRAADPVELSDFSAKLKDERLKALIPLYQARNYPDSLDQEQRAWWENYREQRLTSGGNRSRQSEYFARLEALHKQPRLTKHQKYILEELQLYGQSIVP